MLELISVIIPVYNVADYLSRCLDSILSQTYSNIEIIISDDGSTDGSSDICDEYARRDKRVVVIHSSNKGLSEARNRGLSVSKGKYICFIDSDDWVDKNYVLKLYYALLRTGSDIAECLYVKTTGNSEKKDSSGQIEVFTSKEMLFKLADVNHEKHVVAWNKLYKKEVFENIFFERGKLHEDEFAMHHIFHRANKIAIINDYLYYYFQNQQSIINKKISNNRIDAIDALNDRIVFLGNLNLCECVNKCSSLLFNQFLDFCSINKKRFVDYKAFKKILKARFKLYRHNIKKQGLTAEQKVTFSFCCINFNLIKIYKPTRWLFDFARRVVNKICRCDRARLNKQRKREKKELVKNLKIFDQNIHTPKRRAFILSVVQYCNYGDLAIGVSQKKVLSDHFDLFEVTQRQMLLFQNLIKKYIRKSDIIFLPGGGNMSDVWMYDENIRRMIIHDYPDNTIVIFPQSFGYRDCDGEYFKDSLKLYNSHKQLFIFARDTNSYDLFREYYPLCECNLVPDSVLLLNHQIPHEKKYDIGLCFRDDKETNEDAIIQLIELILTIRECNLSFTFIKTVDSLNTELSERDSLVSDKMAEISSCRLVFSDRLHCLIFCILTNTKCVAINNNNNKVKNFIDTWLSENSAMRVLNFNDKITSTFLNRCLENGCSYPQNFVEKFKKLNDLIEEYAKV